MESRTQSLLARCREPSPWRVDVDGLSRPQADEVAADLKAHGIEARVLDGQTIATKAALLDALAKAFHFPGHFGRNWDALLDCLTDFSALPAKGYVVILWQADDLKRADASTYRAFAEVCQAAAERWAERGGAYFKLAAIK